jgi:hypothetical protein
MTNHGYPPKGQQFCANCFYGADGPPRCLRYAPRPSANTNLWGWPEINGADWCGEWAPQEAAE